MLKPLVRFFSARPWGTVGVWLVVLVAGTVAYTTLLPREGFPSIEAPEAVANGRYLIGDATRLDDTVTTLLATSALQFGDAIEVVSVSNDSTFSIRAEFPDGTSSEEATDAFFTALFVAQLPEEALVGIDGVNESKLLDRYDALIAIHSSAGETPRDLESQARRVRNALAEDARIDGAEVQVLLVEATSLRTGQTVIDETDFNLISVPTANGLEMRPAISVGVTAASGVDSLEVRDAILDVLSDRGELRLDDAYETTLAADYAPQVDRQIGSLEVNALTGIIAVLAIAAPLTSWRSSLITALFMVTVLAASFAVLHLIGITLNTISLLGVILALGLLVDDVIVMTDALQKTRDEQREEQGDERRARSGPTEVVIGAVERVGAATVAGTLTTVLVFAPMLAITGVLGDFVRILPITVITVLLVSLLLSFVFVPVAGRFLLSESAAKGRVARAVDRVGDAVSRIVAGEPSTRSRVVAAGLISVVLTGVGLVVIAPRVGFNIFPAQPDSTEIALEIDYRSGTTIEEARAIALDVNQRAVDALGENLERAYAFVGNPSTSRTTLTLTDTGGRPTAPVLVRDVLAPVSDAEQRARVTFSQISAGPPEPTFPFRAQVFNTDPALAEAAAEAIRSELDGAEIQRGDGSNFRIIEADLEYVDSVAKKNAQRFVEVRARFDADDVSTVTEVTQSFVDQQFPPERLVSLGLRRDGLEFDFGAESENQESFDSMPLAFGIAIGAIVLVLMVQFRSSIHWLLVLLAIPFSFFGVFGGLLITGNVISFFAMLGLIGLIGIAVNNTILLTDAANRERRLGNDASTSIQRAVRQRFRPLVVTTMTTIAAILPLALRDPFWEALGMTIIFGLVSSTVLVLVSFPAFYLATEALRDRWSPPWRKELTEAQPSPKDLRSVLSRLCRPLSPRP